MKAHDGICWTFHDTPSRHRFVTHLRVPVTGWRVPLPAPMPETWVAILLAVAFLVFLTAFVFTTAIQHPAPVAAVESAVAVWLVGKCCVPLADVRLRREAFSVLQVLHASPETEDGSP